MKIFLSWSVVEPSGQFAEALHDWLPTTFSHLQTWVSSSPECLPKGLTGKGFADTIFENILDSDACITIITKESISRPWLYYEAGAFHAQKKPIFAILCEGVTHNDFSSTPLVASGINYSLFSQEELVNIIKSLHHRDGNYSNNMNAERITRMVSNNFHAIQEKYSSIFDEKYRRKHHIFNHDSDV